MTSNAAIERLIAATVSNGAPSARNLLVTVFGDALLPHGADVVVSVRSLAALLEPFGVNERLVRTSLTRLVNDGLLAVTRVGRRSFYGVADDATSLFRQADARIYGLRTRSWDGSWTLVVIDANESTAARRADLRQRLTWAGLWTVAPNVMASPVVAAEEAAEVVGQAGGFEHVMVTRSQLVETGATLDGATLADRSAALDTLAARYRDFLEAFAALDRRTLDALAPAQAFKLRTLLVATYRRTALIDPLLPTALLPDGWVGAQARALAAFIYHGCVDAAERHLAAVAELPHGPLSADSRLLRSRFVVDPPG